MFTVNDRNRINNTKLREHRINIISQKRDKHFKHKSSLVQIIILRNVL